jgi:hypothetical protein
MPKKMYDITLSAQERSRLEKIIKTGASPAKEILRANILLQSDSADDRVPVNVRELATSLSTSPTTVQKVRREYATTGLGATLYRKKRDSPPVPPKVDGEFEARVIAISCQTPPEGYAKWSTRLIASKSVELGHIESVSHSTIASILKKTSSNRT